MVSPVCGRGEGFLSVILFSFWKLVSIRTSPVFLGWAKVGAAQGLSLLQNGLISTPKWTGQSISFLSAASTAFRTEQNLAAFGLAPSLSSMETGLILSFPNPPPNGTGNLFRVCFSLVFKLVGTLRSSTITLMSTLEQLVSRILPCWS